MPYICTIINNTRLCPNEKTNLFNIGFINLHLISFFFAFSRATQKGGSGFKWWRRQRNGAHQSIESD